MKNETYRVRFAPAPTGMMHLGNVRTALMNYLFAQQKQGTFILRIEDTDTARNFDPQAKEIIADLTWLSITYQEGPIVGGPYTPYFQSQRNDIYQEKLDELKSLNKIYPCFCSTEELEKKRVRQQALKQPPRYDRTCLNLSVTEREQKTQTEPHLWRVQLPIDEQVTIHDLSHGDITFDFKNFSDFPLTRMDGTFTFMFANFVDDMTMHMTHVFRGDDHLTNTAGQAALYRAFNVPLPTFWHMPIICNTEGRKLSKRDFGFSLRDLKNSGYLPEAICNYLATIGGSYEQEIMSLEELITHVKFENLHSASHVKYDVEKLNWMNQQWIKRLDTTQLVPHARPILESTYPQVKDMNDAQLEQLLEPIKNELPTLEAAIKELSFFFAKLELNQEIFAICGTPEQLSALATILKAHMHALENSTVYMDALKKDAKEQAIPFKVLFHTLRVALSGKPEGQSIINLIQILGTAETRSRLEAAIKFLVV